MKKRKILQNLTIIDNFLFGAVMQVEENCKGFLEMVLGFPINHVMVSKEKSVIYHPEYRGVRLDIYAEDENHTHYNVEMQVQKKKALGKRSRYYHSQMVMESLESGEDYESLPDTCVPPELVRFLKFVTANLKESEEDFGDELVNQFQNSIRDIKKSREMGERYMIFEEMLREEKQEGLEEGQLMARQESVLECLEELGDIPAELQEEIENLEDTGKLKMLLKLAVRADSIADFEKEAESYFISEE